MSLELVARAQVCDKTVAEYINQPFSWGQRDCARGLVWFHVRGMGHKVAKSKFGTYSTSLGAAKALKKLGYDTLEDAIDGIGTPLGIVRIPPAMAVMGDIIALQSEGGGLSALAVRLDGLNHIHSLRGGFAVSEIQKGYTAAWRVPCLVSADVGEGLFNG